MNEKEGPRYHNALLGFDILVIHRSGDVDYLHHCTTGSGRKGKRNVFLVLCEQ